MPTFQNFLKGLDVSRINFIEIMAHTGRRTIEDVIEYLRKKKSTINPNLVLKILLREPNTEITKRKKLILKIQLKI